MSLWTGYSYLGLKCKEEDVEFFDVRQEPFSIHGLWNPTVNFRRLPDDVAKNSSGAVFSKAILCSGGRIRFATDSPYIAIRFKHEAYIGSPHISRLNSIGADLYVEEDGTDMYYASFYPPIDSPEITEGCKKFPDSSMREIMLFMPVGTEVYEFEVGLKKGSTLKKHRDYGIKRPVVFYGSSITNGVAASRPGNMYEGFVSRTLDCDFINLGFAGSAKGEKAIAEYIAGLDMSAFVLDYDWNAANAEELMETHEKFFEIIREKNSDLPIIMITRPDSDLKEDCQSRRDVILKTYLNARENGDKNVYFIDGYTLFPSDCRRDCTVDGCHPNDLGFYFMAKKIGGVLKEVIKPGSKNA